eukprot:1192946-Prorocentrum_minimum.AAC.2
MPFMCVSSASFRQCVLGRCVKGVQLPLCRARCFERPKVSRKTLARLPCPQREKSFAAQRFQRNFSCIRSPYLRAYSTSPTTSNIMPNNDAHPENQGPNPREVVQDVEPSTQAVQLIHASPCKAVIYVAGAYITGYSSGIKGEAANRTAFPNCALTCLVLLYPDLNAIV